MAKEKGPPQIYVSQNEGYDPRASIDEKLAALSAKVDRIGTMVTYSAQFEGIDKVLMNCFDDVCAKLAPLADLGPTRIPLADVSDLENGDGRLQALVEATARPNWSGAGLLAVPTTGVDFIGVKAPPASKDRRCASKDGSYAS